MKQVEKVSIGRYAFTLEQDAYEMVKKYLSELDNYYSSTDGGAEIMEGIEERMAELLLEKCGKDGVASVWMIEQIIDVLGKPETIEDESSTEEPKSYRYNTKKKFYRNPEHKILGGVCSGLAAYFNMDIVLVRILWVVIFCCFSSVGFITVPWFGTWFVPVVYLVLWIIVPPAKTVSQRCEMKGESGTFDEIGKNIEKGAKVVEQKARTIGQADFWKVLGRVICIIIGVILIIIGTVGLTAGVVALFGVEVAHIQLDIAGISEWISDYSPVIATLPPLLVKIVGMIAFFTPFLGILYGGIQMTFGFKPPKWKPGLVLFVIWLMSLVALAVLGAVGIFS